MPNTSMMITLVTDANWAHRSECLISCQGRLLCFCLSRLQVPCGSFPLEFVNLLNLMKACMTFEFCWTIKSRSADKLRCKYKSSPSTGRIAGHEIHSAKRIDRKQNR